MVVSFSERFNNVSTIVLMTTTANAANSTHLTLHFSRASAAISFS